MWPHWHAVSMLFAIALGTSSCIPPGQRLLDVTIERGGIVIFEGIRGVRDTMPSDQMWGVLEYVPFQLVGDSAKLTTSGQGQLCSLSSEVIVRFRHVDDDLLRADLNSVVLQKSEADGCWYLDKHQASRIEKAGKQ